MNEPENKELEFTRQKKEDYEQLMKQVEIKRDHYWDKNNPFVRLLLFVLGVFIVGGVIYYIVLYFHHS